MDFLMMMQGNDNSTIEMFADFADCSVGKQSPVLSHGGDLSKQSLVRSQEETDALVAKDMNDLSMKDREQVLHDIHGVADIPNEDPSKMQEKFAELESEIQQQSVSEKAAYQQALDISEEYVNDHSFRLKFLRADCFDAPKAAKRMLAFFEQKLEIFGPEKLVKDITLEDLNEDDLEVLNNGHLQLLPQRDRAGRVIFCNVLTHERFKKGLNLLRVIYYMTMAAVEVEETQRKGLVGILYNIGSTCKEHDTRTLFDSAKLRMALPARFVSMHYCYNNPRFMDYINYERCNFDPNTRARCRAHKVSSMECNYELLSFGIPLRVIPTSLLGRLKTEDHEEWVKTRKTKECESSKVRAPASIEYMSTEVAACTEESTKTKPEECVSTVAAASPACTEAKSEAKRRWVFPTPHDVLFGRGKVKDHPGNIRLHHLIDAKRGRYEVSEKWEKTVIAEEIVAIIKESSGRFLKVDGDGWLEVDVEVAREKVSHTFRSRRPKAQLTGDSKRRGRNSGGVGRKRPRLIGNM